MNATVNSPADSKSGEIFTVDEMAEFLHIGRTSAYKLVSAGQIPSFRIGRAIRIKKCDVLALFK